MSLSAFGDKADIVRNAPPSLSKIKQLRTPCLALNRSTPDEIAMTKGWLQRLQNYLQHLSHWRQISTAPYNQELELRITENGETVTLEFPCLRTNEEAWINVDLGSEIKVQPVGWRIWQGGKSPEPHHSKIRLAARRALTHLYLRRAKPRDTGEEEAP